MVPGQVPQRESGQTIRVLRFNRSNPGNSKIKSMPCNVWRTEMGQNAKCVVNEEKRLSFEQGEFLRGKRRLNYLRNKPISEITERDRLEEDKIRAYLWSIVKRFAMNEAQRKMGMHRLPSDAKQDIEEDMALIFFEKLDSYDPTQSTPTTYFVRYFHQAIHAYLLTDSEHLSQYDAANLRKVRMAIAYYERNGIHWTEEMLANKTGLSVKVVRNTIRLGATTIRSGEDDAVNQASPIPDPESAVIDQEVKNALYRTLEEALTNDELELILDRVNIEGPRETPYTQLASQYGTTVKDITKRVNSILCRLNQNQTLRSYYGRDDDVSIGARIELGNDAAEIIENDLIESLQGSMG